MNCELLIERKIDKDISLELWEINSLIEGYSDLLKRLVQFCTDKEIIEIIQNKIIVLRNKLFNLNKNLINLYYNEYSGKFYYNIDYERNFIYIFDIYNIDKSITYHPLLDEECWKLLQKAYIKNFASIDNYSYALINQSLFTKNELLSEKRNFENTVMEYIYIYLLIL